MWTGSLERGLCRLACFTSHRRFLYQECDPFYIHASIQSKNALSMRLIWSVWGGGARVSNLHIVLNLECMCSYVLLCEVYASHGRVKAWQQKQTFTWRIRSNFAVGHVGALIGGTADLKFGNIFRRITTLVICKAESRVPQYMIAVFRHNYKNRF